MRITRRSFTALSAATLGTGAASLGVGAGIATADGPSGNSASSPPVIPALDGWTGGDKSFTLGRRSRILLDGRNQDLRPTAEMLASELAAQHNVKLPISRGVPSARDGDIVLALEKNRDDLGDQGYEFTVEGTVAITGATLTGLFYGTRTLLQLLTMGEQVPGGHAIDIPRHPERGLGIGGGNRTSMERFERLFEEMAYLKLNYLMIEAAVENDVNPALMNSWYYTKEQTARIAELASKYHVTVIPSVNAPGHMWALSGMTEFQLRDANGNPSAFHLDMTNPAAVDFYLRAIDAWSEAYGNPPYWHMGADEFTGGAIPGAFYEQFPVLGEYAREKFGPDAHPNDTFIRFVNRVNEHVKSKGMQLRMWNDSVSADRTIDLDPDIIVEYWTPDELLPSEFVAGGHTVLNAASALYYNASGPRVSATNLCGDVPVGETTLPGCVSLLWENGWHPGVFEDETLDPGNPAIRGAKLSIWSGNVDSENEVQSDLFMPLRFISQRTWGSTEPFVGYGVFTDRAEALGDPIGWAGWSTPPVPGGQYLVRVNPEGASLSPVGEDAGSVVEASGEEHLWQLHRTDDHYYEIVSVETGLALTAGGASPTAELRTGGNTQKWELDAHEDADALLVASASTKFVLILADDGRTLELVMPPLAAPDASAWQFDLVTAATLQITGPDDGLYVPGAATPVAATFTNTSGEDVTNVVLELDADNGWQVESTAGTSFAAVPAGETVTAEWELTVPGDLPAGTHQLGAAASFTDGDGEQTVSQNLQVETSPPGIIPFSSLSVLDFSSEQEGSGEAEYAIDGDPTMPWHSEWWEIDPIPDFPHFISIDLGGRYEVDALSYMTKQEGNDNGMVKDYVIAVSDDGQSWQDVTSGAFPYTREATKVTFSPVATRYVRLTGLNAHNGGPYMAAGEIQFFGTPIG